MPTCTEVSKVVGFPNSRPHNDCPPRVATASCTRLDPPPPQDMREGWGGLTVLRHPRRLCGVHGMLG